MRLILAAALLALLLLLGPLSGIALAASALPDFVYDHPSTTLNQFVLGPSCLSLPASELDLSCNPAHFAAESKRQFRVNLVGSDKLQRINDERIRLKNDDSIGVVNSLIGQREPLVAQAAVTLWYQREWWAVGVTPARAGLSAFSRNPAYPEFAAQMYKETEVFGKFGMLLASDNKFHLGTQIRYVDRDSFSRDFALLDAVYNPALLKIEKHRGLYVEPAISYAWDTEWTTAFSAALTNVPVFQDGASKPFMPVVDFGVSMAPPMGKGKWKTTTHYTSRPDKHDFFDNFRWGSIYDFTGIGAASLMLGKTTFALGFSGHIDSLVLGLAYKTEELSPDQWQTVRISTVLGELGLQF